MNRLLAYSWAGMYVLCVALGTLQGATGLAKAALVLIAVLFFLPPALLLYNGILSGQKKTVKTIRIISLTSLLLTTVCLIVYFVITALYAASVIAPAAVNVAFYVLLAVSSPLFCGQYLYLSLFLWACLFFSTFLKKAPGKK